MKGKEVMKMVEDDIMSPPLPKFFDLNNLVRVIRVGDEFVEDTTSITEYSIDKYRISLYLIRMLKECPKGGEYIHVHDPLRPECSERYIIILPRRIEFHGITETNKVVANCPLWTSYSEILWFKLKRPYWYKKGEKTFYLGYEFEREHATTIAHIITKYPVRIQDAEPKYDEHYPPGHCVYCGAKLPEEPEYYDYGLGHCGEPNVPVFICPECGEENYGFRIGEFVKDVYNS